MEADECAVGVDIALWDMEGMLPTMLTTLDVAQHKHY
jgi:hypothetical protein